MKTMMKNEARVEEMQFVEEVGMAFEATGLPRMAGRIFGWLLIADPPHQSPDQLATALLASKGSISSITRLLIQTGLIERLSLPGVRHDYFRVSENACRKMVGHGIEDEIRMMHHLACHGLEVLGNEKRTLKWLKEMKAWYGFLEREFPALLERWEREKKSQ